MTAPASAEQALEMMRAGMDYLAAADATAMPTWMQAQCLQINRGRIPPMP